MSQSGPGSHQVSHNGEFILRWYDESLDGVQLAATPYDVDCAVVSLVLSWWILLCVILTVTHRLWRSGQTITDAVCLTMEF